MVQGPFNLMKMSVFGLLCLGGRYPVPTTHWPKYCHFLMQVTLIKFIRLKMIMVVLFYPDISNFTF